MKQYSDALPAIGWREWIELPDLGISRIKAKVDTGARTSAVHGTQIEEFERDGETWVRFRLHYRQQKPEKYRAVEARVSDRRSVRSSSGRATVRYVIRTQAVINGQAFEVDLTLATRERMKFRMLLGREAFVGRFVVDVSQSFVDGRR